jgi:hypothetical protein
MPACEPQPPPAWLIGGAAGVRAQSIWHANIPALATESVLTSISTAQIVGVRFIFCFQPCAHFCMRFRFDSLFCAQVA